MSTENSRFDARISQELKEMLEKASELGGYRSLTDFVISTAQTRAREIILEHNRILSSQRDSEVFFNTILNPGKPNKKLHQTVKSHNQGLAE